MSYDPRCYELAEVMLAGEPIDTPQHRDQLAQFIQEQIEDWIQYERDPSVGDEIIEIRLVEKPEADEAS